MWTKIIVHMANNPFWFPSISCSRAVDFIKSEIYNSDLLRIYNGNVLLTLQEVI